MPDRCVVYGCSNVNDPENGISLHRIPFFNDNRSEALARRKKWVDFVKSKRAKWEPTASSHVCSCHFAKEDFSEQFLFPGVKRRRELKKDAVGVVPVPRFQKNAWEEEELSSRTRRQVRNSLIFFIDTFLHAMTNLSDSNVRALEFLCNRVDSKGSLCLS